MSIRCRSLLPGLLLALVAAAPSARADEGPYVEITPFGGYRMGGSFDTVETETDRSRSVDLEDGGSWGIDFGLYRDGESFYELLFSTQDSQFDSSDPGLAAVDVKTEYYHVGGTLLFADEDWMVPWFSFTAGATRFSPDGNYDSETKFSISAGGGLRLPFTDNFAANLGVRGYLTFVDSDSDIFCVSGNEDAGCLVRTSGSTIFQAEALLGLTFRF
jgi:opacity protein-like surface antigen